MEAIDICAVLKENSFFASIDVEELLPVCRRVLDRLAPRLKDDVAEDDARLLAVAVALARFDVFTLLLSPTERFSSYKAGDITIQKDLQKEFRLEQALRDEALAAAADILKDGGFHFALA